MKPIKIKILTNNKKQTATLLCDTKTTSIKLIINDSIEKTYFAEDFYECLGKIRGEHPDIQFLCKGSKINVRPSSMSSQMSLGIKAYELTLGKASSPKDLVDIFDYEENDLTNSREEQEAFYIKWRETPKT
ncbi:hypothetical protein HX866_26685 [Pseudomonas gingeri]|uniref:hypothetical protein n=1 Tax=Pseudomonas gingeri TaxID=117681 RepID=UPI0015A161E7|nr:hypothetical protein [Pseudomonas gingeri]NWA28485.1 hypothetical protein [Pseudomonas gingeri]